MFILLTLSFVTPLVAFLLYLLDKKTNTTKKMCIFTFSSLKSYFFDIYYKRKLEKNVIDSIFFCNSINRVCS